MGVMWVETTSLRACGAAFVCAAEAGLACGICGGDWTLSLRSWEVRWPDWINGPVTLPVSRVCDTVVICARRGSEIVVGLIDRDSRSVLRAECASDAMLVICNDTCGTFWRSRELSVRHLCQAALERTFGVVESSPQHFNSTFKSKTQYTANMPQNEYIERWQKQYV